MTTTRIMPLHAGKGRTVGPGIHYSQGCGSRVESISGDGYSGLTRHGRKGTSD